MNNKKIDIYWVVGSDENVGKTTVASALIESLNQSGQSAIGFKPFSAGKFVDLIDTINSPDAISTGSIFGLDGVSLSAASPLMNYEDIELIQPILFVCYPNYAQPLIIRGGSQLCGKVEYWRGRILEGILGNNSNYFHESVREKFERFSRVELTTLGFLDAPKLDNSHIDRCLGTLTNRKLPEALVIEGAGKWLPMWKTPYVVNHILLVHLNKIHFFKGINMTVSTHLDRLVPLQNLLNQINRYPSKATELSFAASAFRKDVAISAVKSLLASR